MNDSVARRQDVEGLAQVLGVELGQRFAVERPDPATVRADQHVQLAGMDDHVVDGHSW